MTPPETLADVFELYDGSLAQRIYDEAVTERDHALQAAALAADAGEDSAVVVAALFHDVGHLVVGDLRPLEVDLLDDLEHERVGAATLRRFFGPEVTAPVALHVAAKRYLTAVDDDYASDLSPSSVRSLEVQGGPMPAAERERFESLPSWGVALRLRRYDDLAKVPGAATPPMTHYVAVADRVRR